MPMYEYACENCGKRFEHLARSMSEAAPKCPDCGGENEKQKSTLSTRGGSSDAGSCSTGTCPTGTCPL